MPFWQSFKDAFQGKLGAALGAGAAAALIAGGAWLYHYAIVPIDVTSARGPDVRNFIAGEELRFSLKGVQSERVFWVFDEDQKSVVETRGPEIKYTFQFESNKKEPVWNRRVDAFFKSGGSYRSAYKLVSVSNTSIPATVRVDPSGLKVTVPTGGPTGDWTLASAKLGTFENAKVEDKMNLTRASTGPRGDEWKLPESASIAKPLADTKNTWLSLDYVLPQSGRLVRIMKPFSAAESSRIETLVGNKDVSKFDFTHEFVIQ